MKMTRKSYFDVKKIITNRRKKETTVFELILKFHKLSRHGQDFTKSPSFLGLILSRFISACELKEVLTPFKEALDNFTLK